MTVDDAVSSSLQMMMMIVVVVVLVFLVVVVAIVLLLISRGKELMRSEFAGATACKTRNTKSCNVRIRRSAAAAAASAREDVTSSRYHLLLLVLLLKVVVVVGEITGIDGLVCAVVDTQLKDLSLVLFRIRILDDSQWIERGKDDIRRMFRSSTSSSIRINVVPSGAQVNDATESQEEDEHCDNDQCGGQSFPETGRENSL